ncbi:winged helix-turn-helix domain-containing protein [Halomonas sp. WWR20]
MEPDGFGYEDQRWVIQRIADSVAWLTGVRYNQAHMGRLLKQRGWSWQKPRRQDIRRDEADIEHWRDVIWPELKK